MNTFTAADSALVDYMWHACIHRIINCIIASILNFTHEYIYPIEAIREEVNQDSGLLEKPVDGADIWTCISSYGVWDDCLLQTYIQILS